VSKRGRSSSNWTSAKLGWKWSGCPPASRPRGIAGPISTVAGVQPGQCGASEGRPGRRADQPQAVRGLFGEGAISASQRDSAQTQFDVAVASLRSSEAQYESDRAAVKNVEASVVQAVAALDIARKRLQDTDVVSPITGFVSKRLVNVGETLKEKDAADEPSGHPCAEAAGDVPERFAPQVGVEHTVRVEVEAFPGQTFPGKITRVSPTSMWKAGASGWKRPFRIPKASSSRAFSPRPRS